MHHQSQTIHFNMTKRHEYALHPGTKEAGHRLVILECLQEYQI